MKAAVTVKVRGGYLTFPFKGAVTLADVENTEVVSAMDYNYKDKVGKSVVELLTREEEPS